MPKVSVIINCYNGEKYLREAIDSVYSQSFHDWEIIFFDNSSTDNSANIAKGYDDRLRYIKSDSLITLGAARRSAVLVATGEWIAFLDSDDRWYPEKLKTQLDALEKSDYILCYAGIREIKADGKPIRNVYPVHSSGRLLESLLNQFEVNMVTPMFRRALVTDLGINFDANITASEEYNLFVRMAAKGTVLVQHELLGDYRVYEGSLTNRQISQWAFERRYTLEQLKNENPGVDVLYKSAFREALARGDYYEARYLAAQGNKKQAKLVMSKITSVDWRYRLLFWTLTIPGMWEAIHSSSVRGKLISFLSPVLFKR